MILLIDNYDSFVYNLARYFTELGCEAVVCRNDAISIAEIHRLQPAAIVLSPGPGTPLNAGICLEVVREFLDEIPILGVCLGHQVIAAALGAEIVRAPEPVHGRTTFVEHDGQSLFAGLPNPLRATRYHSLIVDEATLPVQLRVTARTATGIVMAIEHASVPVYGVQFHPESILTESGQALLGAFLKIAGIPASAPVLTELAADADGGMSSDFGEEPGPVIHW
ncbi:Aminodeoxychorismate/anthranilate synthase component 2 [Symmachiella dynata]|uniref:anthranilate synthase component II n=1 Tax=Symmachiella dynata TaxID=2527995 RepID=UPI00118912A9|nr:aminodeoxychorismate/anthranilate synthase component II [Symmachiella dynata]QDT47921.1 Aminodeoxychorismate/anthranilate synthase component 2 [Symmachiella dynata]